MAARLGAAKKESSAIFLRERGEGGRFENCGQPYESGETMQSADTIKEPLPVTGRQQQEAMSLCR
jgi:hypothetical protein